MQKINDEDLAKIIEKAHKLSLEEQSRLTLEDVKETARELGIADSKVLLAYQLLEQEKKEMQAKAHQKRQKMTVLVVVGLVVALIAIGAIKAIIEARQPYKGEIQMTFCTNLDKDKRPADNLKEVRLFQHAQIISFIKMQELTKTRDVVWEFYTPEGKLFEKVAVKVVPYKGSREAYVTLKLPISAPIGTWQVKILVDEKPYRSYPLPVNYGYFKATMTSKLGTDDRKTPLSQDIKDTFVKGKDNVAICYLYWDLISPERKGEVAWKWYDPQGKLAKNAALNVAPNSTKNMTWYRANSGIVLKDVQAGEWKVEVYFSDVLVETKNFVVQEKDTK